MTIEVKHYAGNENVIVKAAGELSGTCCRVCSSFLLIVDRIDDRSRLVCPNCDGEIAIHGPAVIKHEDIGSIEMTRFHLPYEHDQPISCGQAVPMFFDRVMKRWRVREQ